MTDQVTDYAQDLRELNGIYRAEEAEVFELDHATRTTWRNNVVASYEFIFGLAICRDMEIACRPLRGVPPEHWPRKLRVLEIGYGDGEGIRCLNEKYRVAQHNITGIEIVPECDKVARERWPEANWYLNQGDDLVSMLEHWADEGIRFDLIVARHVMERIPNAADVVPVIARLLRNTHPRVGGPRGVFVQVTPPKDRTNALISPGLPGGGHIQHFTNMDAIWNPNLKVWEPNGWPDLFHSAGMEIYRVNRHLRKSHPGKREVAIFSITRGDING